MGGYTSKIKESNKTREEMGYRKLDPTQESGVEKFQDDNCNTLVQEDGKFLQSDFRKKRGFDETYKGEDKGFGVCG